MNLLARASWTERFFLPVWCINFRLYSVIFANQRFALVFSPGELDLAIRWTKDLQSKSTSTSSRITRNLLHLCKQRRSPSNSLLMLEVHRIVAKGNRFEYIAEVYHFSLIFDWIDALNPKWFESQRMRSGNFSDSTTWGRTFNIFRQSRSKARRSTWWLSQSMCCFVLDLTRVPSTWKSGLAIIW